MKLQIQQCTHERICCLVTEIRSCYYSLSILGCSQSTERVKDSSVTVWKRTSNPSSLTGCCDEMMKSEQEVVAWILQPFSSWFLWFLPTQIQLPPGLAAARPGDWLLPLFFSPAALPHPAPPGHHPGQPGQLQRWVRVRVRVSLGIRQAKDERPDVYSPVFVLRAVFCVSGQFGAISVSRWSPEHSLARRDWGHPGKLTRTKPVTVSTQSTGFFIGLWLCFPVWPGSSRGSCQAARRRLPASPGSHFWCKDNSEQLRSQHTYTHTHTERQRVSDCIIFVL